MSIDLILPTSMVMAIITWSLIFAWYVHPSLRNRTFVAAMRPLLLLNSFRYIGLMFLIPGVTAEALDMRFAWPAAYGDLLAALLALAALGALHVHRLGGYVAVWVFNIWGLADLLNAVARGIMFTPDGALGATFWIPSLIVPLLLVTHIYIFGRLLKEIRVSKIDDVPLLKRG